MSWIRRQRQTPDFAAAQPQRSPMAPYDISRRLRRQETPDGLILQKRRISVRRDFLVDHVGQHVQAAMGQKLKTIWFTPRSAAPSIRRSSTGITVSQPSGEKRFWPRYFVCENVRSVRRKSGSKAAVSSRRPEAVAVGQTLAGSVRESKASLLYFECADTRRRLSAVGTLKNVENFAQRHAVAVRRPSTMNVRSRSQMVSP